MNEKGFDTEDSSGILDLPIQSWTSDDKTNYFVQLIIIHHPKWKPNKWHQHNFPTFKQKDVASIHIILNHFRTLALSSPGLKELEKSTIVWSEKQQFFIWSPHFVKKQNFVRTRNFWLCHVSKKNVCSKNQKLKIGLGFLGIYNHCLFETCRTRKTQRFRRLGCSNMWSLLKVPANHISFSKL